MSDGQGKSDDLIAELAKLMASSAEEGEGDAKPAPRLVSNPETAHQDAPRPAAPSVRIPGMDAPASAAAPDVEAPVEKPVATPPPAAPGVLRIPGMDQPVPAQVPPPVAPRPVMPTESRPAASIGRQEPEDDEEREILGPVLSRRPVPSEAAAPAMAQRPEPEARPEPGLEPKIAHTDLRPGLHITEPAKPSRTEPSFEATRPVETSAAEPSVTGRPAPRISISILASPASRPGRSRRRRRVRPLAHPRPRPPVRGRPCPVNLTTIRSPT